MQVLMRENMTLQAPRLPFKLLGERGRQRGIEDRLAALEPCSIQRSKAWGAKRARRLVEAFAGAVTAASPNVEIPAQLIEIRRPQRHR